MEDPKYTYPSAFENTSWSVLDGDYYVSTIGNDVTGDGSPKNPFLTLKRAMQDATADDKIVVGPNEYVLEEDDNSGSSGIKTPCRFASIGNIQLSYGTPYVSVDGLDALEINDRILVWQQNVPAENGIYLVKSGAWERVADFNSPENMQKGAVIPVLNGDTYANSIFQFSTTEDITVETTALNFKKITFPEELLNAKLDKAGDQSLDNFTISTEDAAVNADAPAFSMYKDASNNYIVFGSPDNQATLIYDKVGSITGSQGIFIGGSLNYITSPTSYGPLTVLDKGYADQNFIGNNNIGPLTLTAAPSPGISEDIILRNNPANYLGLVFEGGGDSYFDETRTVKKGVQLKGYGETSLDDATGADYSELTSTSLIPKQVLVDYVAPILSALQSDDTSLDSFQEIVDALKQAQNFIATIDTNGELIAVIDAAVGDESWRTETSGSITFRNGLKDNNGVIEAGGYLTNNLKYLGDYYSVYFGDYNNEDSPINLFQINSDNGFEVHSNYSKIFEIEPDSFYAKATNAVFQVDSVGLGFSVQNFYNSSIEGIKYFPGISLELGEIQAGSKATNLLRGAWRYQNLETLNDDRALVYKKWVVDYIAPILATLQSNDSSLDSFQELVDEFKALKTSVEALEETSSTETSLTQTIDFQLANFQPKTVTGSITINTITNPSLGSIILPISGGSEVKFDGALIPTENVLGLFDANKSKNFLKLTCYDEVAPAYFAEWVLEGAGTTVQSTVLEELEIQKTSTQAVSSLDSDVTGFDAGTAIDSAGSSVSYNATTGEFTLAPNKQYAVSINANYRATNNSSRSTIDLRLVDSSNALQSIWESYAYIREVNDKSSLSFIKKIVVGASPIDIKFMTFLSKSGSMSVEMISALVKITVVG